MTTNTRAGELPSKYSYSSFNSWLHCAKQFELEKVQRVTRKPAWWFVGGTSFHEWSEDFDRGTEGAPAIEDRFLANVAKEEEGSGVERAEWSAAGRVTKANPLKEAEDWWLATLPLMAEKYVQWREKTAWPIWTSPDGNPGIELSLEWKLGEETIRAIIDRVFVLPRSSVVVPVDLKTGARTPDNSVQLGVYRVGLHKVHGVMPKYGYYYDARKGEHTSPIQLSNWSPALFTELYRQFNAAVENRIFIPKVGGQCNTCSVRQYCAVAGGANAKGVDPLAEMIEIPF